MPVPCSMVPEGALFRNNGSSKPSFSSGFIRFFDMADCHVIYSEKPNAFLILSEAISAFLPNFHLFSIGFIRIGDMADCHVIYSEKPNGF